MKKVYESIPPLALLVITWGLVLCAMLLRLVNGLDLPLLNVLFIVIGIGAFFLPTRFGHEETGEILRRKLLWLLVLAGLLVFAGDLIQLFLPGLISW